MRDKEKPDCNRKGLDKIINDLRHEFNIWWFENIKHGLRKGKDK